MVAYTVSNYHKCRNNATEQNLQDKAYTLIEYGINTRLIWVVPNFRTGQIRWYLYGTNTWLIWVQGDNCPSTRAHSGEFTWGKGRNFRKTTTVLQPEHTEGHTLGERGRTSGRRQLSLNQSTQRGIHLGKGKELQEGDNHLSNPVHQGIPQQFGINFGGTPFSRQMGNETLCKHEGTTS